MSRQNFHIRELLSKDRKLSLRRLSRANQNQNRIVSHRCRPNSAKVYTTIQASRLQHPLFKEFKSVVQKLGI
jgi:hypothetical protein